MFFFYREADKAADLFLEALQGVIFDDYMLQYILQTEENDPQRISTTYFLKVFQRRDILELQFDCNVCQLYLVYFHGKNRNRGPLIFLSVYYHG